MAAIIALLVLLTSLPIQASASSSIRASIPQFPLSINGQKLDQAYSKYPFLFYRDITYLPLTWNHLQALGLESEWSDDEGLKIWTNQNFPPPIHESPVEQDVSGKRNGSVDYAAKAAGWPIRLNQTAIDNAVEPYPFITFRDVTYMPLTWRNVHDLLQIDIRWSEADGLHLIGGQHIISSLIGDDDRSLYFYSMLSADPAKSMLKIDKTFNHVEWMGQKALKEMTGKAAAPSSPYAGKPAEVQRKGRDLYYGGMNVYTLTDADVWESADWGAPVHTYTEFRAGEGAAILSVNIRLPLPVIGPNYGSTYTFLIRGGQVTELKDFNQKIDRVIPNPDGTVWIASARLPSRSGYIGGSARVALLDREGKLHLVNELLDEADVMALGLNNSGLANPAGPDGSLYVVLLGRSKDDFTVKDSDGLYELKTSLQTVRLSKQVSGEYYLDKNRSIFVQQANNTLVNELTGASKTWFDHELAQLKPAAQ
ncbi:hypothetical protein [Paenibacillus caseinilyticus]|nr:hypothetical protein [Paenibacillus caseinilyticus]MCZ8519638.1 hypothetical protein [Paenibacillus caseinilyticus]